MAIARYQKKISRPLLDHIDIHIAVPRFDYEKLANHVAEAVQYRPKVGIDCGVPRCLSAILQHHP
jgi:predicted ATPase with chaperone activity